ncbi:hypothetical protein FJT64_019234 [Amphibalanus amphitrite]|uniref:Peptidase A2 domain-containing protein n=1 Tax=Amphibalanus amphitrite TaxID=1232801 RepID=A0A6A4X467_AMPAM|nr:hypothetical protein FJT64_019234 [Amphibalanus amphitrite]
MTLPVNGVAIKMVVDTGSPITAVGRDTVIPRLRLKPTQLQLSSFTGHRIPLRGEADVSVRFRGRDHRLRLVVVDLPGDRRLLGRDWLRALDISVGGGETAVMDVTPDRGTADLEAVCNRHKALSRILSPERELPTLAAARLQRYALQLAAFTYDVELRPSEDMHLADSLSRMAVPGGEVEPTDAEDDNSGGSYLLFMDGLQHQLLQMDKLLAVLV